MVWGLGITVCSDALDNVLFPSMHGGACHTWGVIVDRRVSDTVHAHIVSVCIRENE